MSLARKLKRNQQKLERARNVGKPLRGRSWQPKSHLPLCLPESAQKRIYSQAESGCLRSWKTLERNKKEIEHYHKYDLAGYGAWYKKTFNDALSEIAALQRTLQEKETILYSVRRESMAHNISAFEAYKRVTSEGYKFEVPQSESTETFEDQNFSFGGDFFDDAEFDEEADCDCPFCRAERRAGKGDSDFEAAHPDEILFEIFEQSIGFDLDADEKAAAFQDFKKFAETTGMYQELFGNGPSSDRRYGNDDSERCSALFRRLAKALHPDRAGSFSEQEKDLWQRAVEAYKQNDLPRLEVVWLHYSIFNSNKIEQDLPVSSFLALQHDLKQQNKEKRREIRRLKKGQIWGFANLDAKGLERLRQSESYHIVEQKKGLQQFIKELQGMLHTWETAKQKNSANPRRTSDNQIRPQSGRTEQSDLWE